MIWACWLRKHLTGKACGQSHCWKFCIQEDVLSERKVIRWATSAASTDTSGNDWNHFLIAPLSSGQSEQRINLSPLTTFSTRETWLD